MNDTKEKTIPPQCRDCRKRKVCEELGCMKEKTCGAREAGDPASVFAPYDFPDLRY